MADNTEKTQTADPYAEALFAAKAQRAAERQRQATIGGGSTLDDVIRGAVERAISRAGGVEPGTTQTTPTPRDAPGDQAKQIADLSNKVDTLAGRLDVAIAQLNSVQAVEIPEAVVQRLTEQITLGIMAVVREEIDEVKRKTEAQGTESLSTRSEDAAGGGQLVRQADDVPISAKAGGSVGRKRSSKATGSAAHGRH